MDKCDVSFPIPLPDDPKKWDGWNNYSSPNYYERLCLDPHSNPSNDLIEEHCRELLRWWQKKLPLKNQPSNPLAQILRAGLDESSRYITEARVELLDPSRRRKVDEQLADQQREAAVVEFQKYISFATADGVLTDEEERNLVRFGTENGLSQEKMTALINARLQEGGIQRAKPVSTPTVAYQSNGHKLVSPEEEFLRLLHLSGLDTNSMTDDQRDALINMAENLSLDPGEAEDLVDVYLEEADEKSFGAAVSTTPGVESAKQPMAVRAVDAKHAAPKIELNPQAERARYPNFPTSLGFEMLFVPSGEFTMGSEDSESAPNERPLTKVTLNCFYLSRYLITNGDYEKFDPQHIHKRMPGATPRHPVIHVNSAEAIKFCQWLSARERKKYRLPTEAEWEFAARGSDGRRYPWGNHTGRGDLGNFADRNTVFAWSDRDIDDGYSETSPVGAFPLGASPFGIEDMAGNVWEWCGDYYAAYSGASKVNPRGATVGARRVYRGGSWKSRFNSMRATVRGSNAPNYSCNDLGFRIVCDCD